MKKLAVALALIATPASAQMIAGPTVDAKLNSQQTQTILHALDVLVKTEGIGAAGVALDAAGAINHAITDYQAGVLKAQMEAAEAKKAAEAKAAEDLKKAKENGPH